MFCDVRKLLFVSLQGVLEGWNFLFGDQQLGIILGQGEKETDLSISMNIVYTHNEDAFYKT